MTFERPGTPGSDDQQPQAASEALEPAEAAVDAAGQAALPLDTPVEADEPVVVPLAADPAPTVEDGAPLAPPEPAVAATAAPSVSRAVASPRRQMPQFRAPGLSAPLTTEATVLVVVMTLSFLLFVLIEPTPRWLALCTAVVAALGTEGVLRAARRDHFATADSTPYLFLPALFALAAPVFTEYNVTGFWAVPAALLGGLAFAAVLTAELTSATPHVGEPGTPTPRATARFYAAAATYFVVFALFSLSYAFELDLFDALIAVALITTLCSVELLRDDEIDPLETLAFSAVVGVLIAESRWVLQYLPIDGYLAGLVLLLLFYFATGVVHAYITRQLDFAVAAEYAAVSVLGIAVITGARVAGVA